MKNENLKKGQIVAWEYDGKTAVGVIAFDEETFISVAVNYFMDSNVCEGELWYSDNIYNDKDTEIRFATDEEIRILIDALKEHKEQYKYDEKAKTIRLKFD